MHNVDSGQEPTENNEPDNGNTDTAEKPEDAPDAQPDGNNDIPADRDTFPRSYVENLCKENADYRTKAKAAEEQADTFAKRLHAELVKATNRLENPADLPYDAKHLDDPERLKAALDALLSDRPYFAKRVVTGDAGQGARGGHVEPFSLLSRLKGGI